MSQVAVELLHLPGEPAGVEENDTGRLDLAGELLHLPGEPAGVEENDTGRLDLAGKLLHLPDEPAGVGMKTCRARRQGLAAVKEGLVSP